MRNENIEKILTEVKKGIVIGLLLTGFYGVGAYIYKSQTKNAAESKNEIKDNDKNNGDTEAGYEIYGYRYKNEGDKESKVLKRNLGYEKRIAEAVNKEEVYNKLKSEYCAAIAEVKKVDKKIMPGTNIPFLNRFPTLLDLLFLKTFFHTQGFFLQMQIFHYLTIYIHSRFYVYSH